MNTGNHRTSSDDKTRFGQTQVLNVESSVANALLPLKKSAMHLFGFSAAINLLALSLPIFMIQIFDRVLTSHSFETLTVIAIATISALIIMAILDTVRSQLLGRIGVQAEQNLTETLPLFEDPAHLRDAGVVRHFIASAACVAMLDVLWTPLFLLVIFFLSPTLGWIATLGAFVLIGHSLLTEMMSRKHRLATATMENGAFRFAAHIKDTTKDCGLGHAKAKIHDAWLDERGRTLSAWLSGADRIARSLSIARFIRLVLQIGLISSAAVLVVSGHLTAGAMIAASVIAARAISPLERGQELWRGLVETRAALNRLERLSSINRSSSNRDIRLNGAGLVIEDLRLSNPSFQRPAFTGVSLNAEPGQLIGITGPSGSGKSTLLRSISGAEANTEGVATIGGADTKTGLQGSEPPVVGYLSQSPQLLPGSVGENLTGFLSSDHAVIEARAEMLGIDDAIKRMPYGYATDAIAFAHLMPAATKQMLSISGCTFGNPRLVLLDEPQTHLDNQGVESVYRLVATLCEQGSVVVVVSQRPSLLARCASVYVMSGGVAQVLERNLAADLRLLNGNATERPIDEKRLHLRNAS